MITKYTQNQVEEIEDVVTLLTKSDQWGRYVGTDEDTKKIDEMLKQGDLVGARMHLSWITTGDLTYSLAKVAVRARKDYLDSLGSEPEFLAKPQLTNPVTSS